jgi:hypothetical protein
MYRTLIWSGSSDTPMNESAIRAKHRAPGKARVSTYKYRGGSSGQGTSKPATIYVLTGRITFQSHQGLATFVPGNIFEFSGGDYTLGVEGDEQATVVWAWEFPPGFVGSWS